MKKALLASYQKAIVQKYDVKKDSLANGLISIITLLQDPKQRSDFLFDMTINFVNDIITKEEVNQIGHINQLIKHI